MDHPNMDSMLELGAQWAATLPWATQPQAPMLTPKQRKAALAAEAARFQHRGPRPAQQCTVHSIFYEVRDRWVPMLRLRGLWLEELGLGVGSRVSIQGEAGKLTITLIAPPAGPVEARKPGRKRRSGWEINRDRRRALMSAELA